MVTFKTACPLDCFDQCAFLVGVEGGKVVSLEADPGQPVNGGFICAKGRKLLERINHPGRLLYPQLKVGRAFKRISWAQAAELVAEKITAAVEAGGPTALLHFYDSGYGGLLKNIEGRFFSALGGCTLHRGSLCWGAGIAAQRYDFGAVMAHPHEDVVNAKLIIIWGRNPANTQLHLLPYLKRARAGGARVIVIDPLQTATAKLADRYIRVKPASDGALALGMAQLIIERGLYDRPFVEERGSGFKQYQELCAGVDLAEVARATGLSVEEIEALAVTYAETKPAAILLGIGLQRHSNGGNMIRAIDALAALTGNVGVPGGGASYANFRTTRLIDHGFLSGQDLSPDYRYYPKPQLAAVLENFKEPPVKFIYVSRANPLTQVGDSNRLRQALKQVPFIVTYEHFMTDTAAASDLVLPATNFLEAEDLYFNSMSHQYLVYGEKVLEPPGECRPEYEFWAEVAGRLGLAGFPAAIEPDELLTRAVRPLTETYGITLQQIREEGPLLLPGGEDIPWSDHQFETADGKYNFYSKRAAADGAGGLPQYREPVELTDRQMKDKGYPYWFVTPHMRGSIHSTHLLPAAVVGPVVKPEVGLEPKAYLHPLTAQKEQLADGELVAVSSKRGRIELRVEISDAMPPDTVMVYQGWWEESGAAVNKLTPDRLTDFGSQAAYYDCLCRVEKL
jgi:anaerobic selenocysteine-containing dehydrogenase